MTVIFLERVPTSLRGNLSRWMVEASTGVFVGCLSGLVRDELWALCTDLADGGTVQMIWKTNTPQGFDVRTWNPRGRYTEQVDGVWLVRVS